MQDRPKMTLKEFQAELVAQAEVQDAFNLCLENDKLDVAHNLLDKVTPSPDVNVHLTDHYDGMTPLMVATYKEHLPLVNSLLNAKADVNAKDDEGYNVLHYVAPKYQEDHKVFLSLNTTLINRLIEAKADVNSQNIKGKAALHEAVVRESSSYIKLLLDAKADIEIKNRHGETPLLIAANSKEDWLRKLPPKDVFITLLEAGANVHATNNKGKSLQSLLSNNPEYLEIVDKHSTKP